MAKKTKNESSGAGALQGVFEGKLSDIVADEKFNARKDYSGKDARDKEARQTLEELASTIERDGQMQPVLVRKLPNGKLSLIYGFRRYRALQILAGEREDSSGKKWKARTPNGFSGPGLIRYQVFDGDERDAILMNLTENMARNDLLPWELADRIKLIKDEYEMSGTEIGQRVGKSKSYVDNLLRIAEKVHPDILKAWRDPKRSKTLTMPDLYTYAGMKDESGENGTPEAQKEQLKVYMGKATKEKDGSNGANGANGAKPGGNTRPSKAKLDAAYEACMAALTEKKKSKDWTDGARAALLFASGKKKTIPAVYSPDAPKKKVSRMDTDASLEE